MNPEVVPPTHVSTVAISGMYSAVTSYVKIITLVNIKCFRLESISSCGYKIPNRPSFAGFAVSGVAGIN